MLIYYLKIDIQDIQTNEYSINRNHYPLKIQTVEAAKVGVICYLKNLTSNMDYNKNYSLLKPDWLHPAINPRKVSVRMYH